MKYTETQKLRYKEALRLLEANGMLSVSLLQRRLCIGYEAGTEILTRMLDEGVVIPHGSREYMFIPKKKGEQQ